MARKAMWPARRCGPQGDVCRLQTQLTGEARGVFAEGRGVLAAKSGVDLLDGAGDDGTDLEHVVSGLGGVAGDPLSAPLAAQGFADVGTHEDGGSSEGG